MSWFVEAGTTDPCLFQTMRFSFTGRTTAIVTITSVDPIGQHSTILATQQVWLDATTVFDSWVEVNMRSLPNSDPIVRNT